MTISTKTNETIFVLVTDEEDATFNTEITAIHHPKEHKWDMAYWKVGPGDEGVRLNVYDDELDAYIELLTELKRRSTGGE